MFAVPAPAVTDALLMSRVASGDAGAFEAVYDRHRVQAYSLACRIAGRRQAEEVTQDAFVSVWRTAGRFDADRGSLATWVLALVRNRSIDLIRRERSRVVAGEWSEEAVNRLPAASDTETEVLAAEDARHARSLIETLPAEQRRVIDLAYFGGYSQQEIATGMNVPLGTVKGRARLALARLREASAVTAA